jgi:ADP-ribose pyrophosphatase
MSDRAAYRALMVSRPDLFRNPEGAGTTILLDDEEIRQAEEHIAEQLRKRGAPAEWAEVGVAFRDQYLFLIRDAVRFSNGSLGTYLRTVDPEQSFPGVVMLPVWQGKVLLIRHFRHASRAWHLEVPRGFGMDADPSVSALRELTEEIGASDVRLVELGHVYQDAAADDTPVAFFYAEVGSFGNPETDETITDILPTDISEFERMIREGELKDGFLLTAYGLAKAKGVL